jgi:hypothetical protein
MPSGREKLAKQVERLPLDTALKTAVVAGINHTDDESAGREAEVLRAFLDELPRDLQAVRDAVARDRRRRTEGTSSDRPIEVTHGDVERARGLTVNDYVQAAIRVVAICDPTLVEKLPVHGVFSTPDRMRRARELSERVSRSSQA